MTSDKKQIVSKMARRFNKALRNSMRSIVKEDLYKAFKQIVWDTIDETEQKARLDEALNWFGWACKFDEGMYPNPTTPEMNFQAFITWGKDRVEELKKEDDEK